MKSALVLGGGGSKGAYEIGVWKALRELDIHFDIVTGTSIGALIGAMVVQDDFAKAYDLWDHMDASQVIQNGVSLDFDLDLLMSQRSQIKQMLASYLNHRGADITPLMNMIANMFDADKFFASDIDFGCMTVCLDPYSPSPFVKSQFTKDNAHDFLLASASCFPAFPMKYMEGKRYIDGGYHDNVPIELARSLGADQIVAVDLKYKEEKVNTDDDVLYIEPNMPLGSFLDFKPETLHRNMRLGYLDTLKKFNVYYGYIYTFAAMDLPQIQAYEDAYERFLNGYRSDVSQPIVNRLFQQLVDRSMNKALAEYESYMFQYLRILEDCARMFDMDDELVYTFDDFVIELLRRFDTMVHTIDKVLISKKTVKEIALEVKNYRQEDIIYYLYHRLKQAKQQDRDDLSYLSVFFKKEYIAALTIFALKYQFQTK